MVMGSSTGGVPPGFRFHPTDEELLHYYLKKKVTYQKFDMDVIREVDLNKMEPWELQETCRIGSAPQHEWYFFSHKDRKYPTGSRTNRATNAGFWKATGRDKCIRNTYKKIGMRKTLVFYRGRAPHGQKTDWIMHEYRLEDGDDAQGNSNEDGWVVCRVFKKKNLFKVGNEGGGTSMNSSDQQLNTSNTTNQPRNFMRDNPYPLCQHHDHQQLFELNKTTELALRYPHLATPQYHSLFQSQTLMSNKPLGLGYDYSSASAASAFPSDQSPVMAKQLLMSGTRDCESAGSESLRYQTCEPGLEVGTCEPGGGAVHPHQQQMVAAAAAAARDDQGLNEWAMLDRIVTPHEDHGNNAASSVHPINHLSSREEMDFWGYGK